MNNGLAGLLESPDGIFPRSTIGVSVTGTELTVELEVSARVGVATRSRVAVVRISTGSSGESRRAYENQTP
jgi:hypothetical protein